MHALCKDSYSGSNIGLNATIETRDRENERKGKVR